MTEYICEFCNTKFVHRNNLYTHKKKAAFCLKIQEKLKNKEISRENNDHLIFLYQCEYCDKTFRNTKSQDRHEKLCAEKQEEKMVMISLKELNSYKEQINLNKEEINAYKHQIRSYKQQISIYKKQNEKYEKELFIIAKQPKQINNNNNSVTNNNRTNYKNNVIQNLQPITNEDYEQLPQKIREEHIFRGPGGYSNFIGENFENKIVCTDLSRKVIKYKKDDKIVTDTNCLNLLKDTFKVVNPIRAEIIENAYNRMNTSLEERLYDERTNETRDIILLLHTGKESPFTNKIAADISTKFYVDKLNTPQQTE